MRSTTAPPVTLGPPGSAWNAPPASSAGAGAASRWRRLAAGEAAAMPRCSAGGDHQHPRSRQPRATRTRRACSCPARASCR